MNGESIHFLNFSIHSRKMAYSSQNVSDLSVIWKCFQSGLECRSYVGLELRNRDTSLLFREELVLKSQMKTKCHQLENKIYFPLVESLSN
jgi:hypothetical protein